jgi:formate--tetrahydrofolate ligase
VTLPRPIAEVAEGIGLLPEELELHGPLVAKVRLEALERLAERPEGRLVVVTAVTPSPPGEGKTATAIGLAQGSQRRGRRAAVTLRQPSMGPLFGIKGGGAGGGLSQLVPAAQVNLGLTGDIHAVGAAHNLLAAFLDNHLFHGNALGIDPAAIDWPRAVDLNDRALRHVRVGLGGPKDGVPRDSEFVITVASEVMAVLALATSYRDLRERLGRIVLALRADGSPVTADDLHVAGAMAAVLRDALKPNLVQTLEGGPAWVHAGPFANIAHGNSSVLADWLALRTSDLVLTEAGFGADMGAEKCFDIKCRAAGLRPAAAVVVATARALRLHGGAADPTVPDAAAVGRGGANLAKQVENVRAFGVPAVVVVNAHPGDGADEVAAIRDAALAAGARAAVVSRHYAEGGDGALEAADAVWEAAAEGGPDFRSLYPLEASLATKVETVAREMYGADGVDLAPEAAERLARYEALGYGGLPVCMAKTHLSLTHDPKVLGRPTGWRLPVRDARLAAGAGFVVVLCGAISRMPGLPSHPAGEAVDIDDAGNVVGLA